MKNKVLFYFGMILILTSCYPGGGEYVSDYDVVYTNYDEKFEFPSKGTYSIPDKIVKITGASIGDEGPEFVDPKFAGPMLTRMKENMNKMGWELVDSAKNANVVLLPAVWTNTTVYYWYDYWCWYYPYYCGWGWGYPSVSSYTTGTLVMTLIADGDNYVDPSRVWTSAINGLLSGAYNASRVTSSIDQAFVQSPYLDVK